MPTRKAQPCPECGRARSGRAQGVLICRCHEKRRTAEQLALKRADQLADLAALLAELDPTVTTGRVEDVVAQAAPSAGERATLVKHLTEQPQSLTSGGSRMPKVVAERLAYGDPIHADLELRRVPPLFGLTEQGPAPGRQRLSRHVSR